MNWDIIAVIGLAIMLIFVHPLLIVIFGSVMLGIGLSQTVYEVYTKYYPRKYDV